MVAGHQTTKRNNSGKKWEREGKMCRRGKTKNIRKII